MGKSRNVGSDNPMARLNEQTVADMRRRHYIEGEDMTALAEEYGVHQSTAYLAITGQTWKHVKAFVRFITLGRFGKDHLRLSMVVDPKQEEDQ